MGAQHPRAVFCEQFTRKSAIVADNGFVVSAFFHPKGRSLSYASHIGYRVVVCNDGPPAVGAEFNLLHFCIFAVIGKHGNQMTSAFL